MLTWNRISRGSPYASALLVLIVGLALAAGAVAVGVALIGDPYLEGMSWGSGMSGFEMPGPSSNWYFESGERRVFYMYRVDMKTFGDSPYSLPSTPPDTICTVMNEETGEAILVSKPTSYFSYKNASTEGTAIAAFTIPVQGLYTIECKYADGAATPSVMLYQGPITIVTMIATLIAIGAPWVAGLIIIGISARNAVRLFKQGRVQA